MGLCFPGNWCYSFYFYERQLLPGYILQPRDSCCSLLQCMQPPPLFVLILLSSPNLTSPSVVLFISRLQHTTHLYVTLKSPSLFFSLYFLQFCFTFFKEKSKLISTCFKFYSWKSTPLSIRLLHRQHKGTKTVKTES